MSLQKLMTNYADYNFWVNQQYVNWLSTKPGDLLHKECPSSFSSIIKTLNHIWATDEYWYSIIAEIADFEKRYHIEKFDTEEVFKGLLKRSGLLSELIKSYTEEDLLKNIKVVSPWFECEYPKYEYLQHSINHSTYHRGQVVTIGRNVGISDAPMTDYNYYNVIKQ